MTNKKTIIPYILLLPSLVLLTILIFYPILKTFQISFMNYVIYEPYNIKYIGFENFIKAFNDNVFLISLKNTFIWVFLSLLGQFVFGLILALLLNRKFKFRGMIRAILFLPWAISGFLIGVMWRWMYQAQAGVINDILLNLGIIQKNIPFLSKPNTALLSVIVACIWWGIPFFAIMFLSALQSIPPELYEASSVDGATSFQKFWNITLPYLKPTMVNTSILRTIWIFNFVDLIYIMTKGGPYNTSQILSSYSYITASKSLDFGYASALCVIAIAILFVYSLFYLYISRNAGGEY